MINLSHRLTAKDERGNTMLHVTLANGHLCRKPFYNKHINCWLKETKI